MYSKNEMNFIPDEFTGLAVTSASFDFIQGIVMLADQSVTLIAGEGGEPQVVFSGEEK